MPAIGAPFNANSVRYSVDNNYIGTERSASTNEQRDNFNIDSKSDGSVTKIKGGKYSSTLELENLYIDDVAGLAGSVGYDGLRAKFRAGTQVLLSRLEPSGSAFGSLSNPTNSSYANAICTSMVYDFPANGAGTLSASFAISGEWGSDIP